MDGTFSNTWIALQAFALAVQCFGVWLTVRIAVYIWMDPDFKSEVKDEQ